MVQHEVTRTLVKSQPEVWAQCSEADSLERHLSGSFGEIRITRLEPEHSVAWEGEQVSGTVKIEPSAWGTRVTMAVQVEGEEEQVVPPPAEPPEPEAEPPAQPEPGPPPRLWARLRARLRRPPEPAVVAQAEAPAPDAPAEREPDPEAPRSDAAAALQGALESLGQAHHRPYSRA